MASCVPWGVPGCPMPACPVPGCTIIHLFTIIRHYSPIPHESNPNQSLLCSPAPGSNWGMT